MSCDATPETLLACRRCQLSGDAYAMPRFRRGTGRKVMFVGEAPGRSEVVAHTAFVGRAGKELDRWISYMGIKNYYITNAVKHRPTLGRKNRPPTPSEIHACSPYLASELEHERPDVLVLLGSSAVRAVAPQAWLKLPLSRLIHETTAGDAYIDEIRTFVLFHPSYSLRMKNMDPGFEASLRGILDSIAAVALEVLA